MRPATLGLLVFLGLAGLFGGVAFLYDPSGAALGLDASPLPPWLPGDYLLPGLALVSLFGAFPLATAWSLGRRAQRAWFVASLIGGCLLIWMAVQIAIIGLILPPMQVAFILVGAALVVAGARGGRQAASVR